MTTPYYSITARGPAAAELRLYGPIGESFFEESVTARQLVADLATLQGKTLTVYLNSPGGSVMDATAIYNALQRHAMPVNIIVDGWAVSAASLIAMAGQSLSMGQASLLMLHNPRMPSAGTAEELRKAADLLDTVRDQMVGIYAKKTGADPETIAAWMDKETWFDASAALDVKLADAITEQTTPPAGIPAAKTFSLPVAYAHYLESPAMPDATPVETTATPPTKTNGGLTQAIADAERLEAMDNDNRATIEARAIANERQRVTTIRAQFAPMLWLMPDYRADLTAYQEQLIHSGASVAQATEQMMDKLGRLSEPLGAGQGAQMTPMGHPRHFQVTSDSRDRFRTGMSEALLIRAGLKPNDANNEFRGLTLLEMSRASLTQLGVSAIPANKLNLVAAAITHTGSDFPYLLADTAEKAMLRGYTEANETFQMWTRAGTLADFKAASRIGMSEFSDMDEVKEGGEFKHGSVGERREQIQLATYGKLFSISRQAIINDDLGAFTDLPRKMGRAAIRKVGDLAYAVLTANAAMADGVALFHANHSNLVDTGSGAAPSATSISTTRAKMGLQTDSSGNANLNIRPKYLLVPLTLEDNARVVVTAQYDPDTANKLQKPNPILPYRLEVISDSRLDTASTAVWYLAADPGIFDTVEIAYLDGNPSPYLEQQNGWTVDGVEFKVRIDAAAKALDHRTLAKNMGA